MKMTPQFDEGKAEFAWLLSQFCTCFLFSHLPFVTFGRSAILRIHFAVSPPVFPFTLCMMLAALCHHAITHVRWFWKCNGSLVISEVFTTNFTKNPKLSSKCWWLIFKIKCGRKSMWSKLKLQWFHWRVESQLSGEFLHFLKTVNHAGHWFICISIDLSRSQHVA